MQQEGGCYFRKSGESRFRREDNFFNRNLKWENELSKYTKGEISKEKERENSKYKSSKHGMLLKNDGVVGAGVTTV